MAAALSSQELPGCWAELPGLWLQLRLFSHTVVWVWDKALGNALKWFCSVHFTILSSGAPCHLRAVQGRDRIVLQHGGKLNSVKAAHKLQKADFATSEQGCSPCSRCQLPKGCPSAGAALLLTPRDVQGPASPASPRWHWDRAACAVTLTEAKPTASKAQVGQTEIVGGSAAPSPPVPPRPVVASRAGVILTPEAPKLL